LTLLDANALISVLRREAGGFEVAELLRTGKCATPAACVAEVVDLMSRRYRVDSARLSERLGGLLDETVGVLQLDSGLAWRAGMLRAQHYNRKTMDLSLADCVLLATAGPEDEIATSDGAVAKTAHRLEIGVIPLLDSSGRRPDLD